MPYTLWKQKEAAMRGTLTEVMQRLRAEDACHQEEPPRSCFLEYWGQTSTLKGAARTTAALQEIAMEHYRYWWAVTPPLTRALTERDHVPGAVWCPSDQWWITIDQLELRDDITKASDPAYDADLLCPHCWEPLAVNERPVHD